LKGRSKEGGKEGRKGNECRKEGRKDIEGY
jgi:hypothetical protein